MVLLISKHMKQGLDLMDWNIHLDTFLRLWVYPIVYRSVSLCLGEFVSLTKITGLILEELAVEVLLTTRSCARFLARAGVGFSKILLDAEVQMVKVAHSSRGSKRIEGT